MREPESPDAEFTRFVKGAEPRLSYAFFAAYGPEVGADVTSESLAYAWEHWDGVREIYRDPEGLDLMTRHEGGQVTLRCSHPAACAGC